jgi:prepilin-type processing-associated H-X9-DG protein
MRIFTCPSNVDQMQGGGASVQAGEFLKNDGDGYTPLPIPTSFAFNEAIVGWSDYPTPNKATVNGHNRCRGNLSRLVHPADMLLAADGNPRGGPTTWVVFNDDGPNENMETLLVRDPGIVDRVRHNGMVGILFADFHCEDVGIPSLAAAAGDTTRGGVFNQISVDVGLTP